MKKNGKWQLPSCETAWAITSAQAVIASPKELLRFSREHWAVENKLHWKKDTIFLEDRCTNRKGYAPENIASLGNMALWCATKIHHSTTRAIEIAQDDRDKAIQSIMDLY